MFFKRYTQKLLKSGDITVFIEGIQKNPRRFFAQAAKQRQQTLADMAEVIDLSRTPAGQTAVLLGLTGALKLAAKSPHAPKGAPALAQKLGDDLMRVFKAAGQG